MATFATNPFSKWHGLDRGRIEWHPTIDEKRCTGCGLCVVTCGEKRNVFGYDRERRKAVVLTPNNCMVGCVNCMVGCLWNAISFPEPESVRALAKSLAPTALDRELEQKLSENPGLGVD